MRTVLRVAVGFILALLVPFGGQAQAVQIEAPDRTVKRLEVTYNEFTPTHPRSYARYFELNDGSAWRYLNYRRCAVDNAVPNRICRTAFWYAR